MCRPVHSLRKNSTLNLHSHSHAHLTSSTTARDAGGTRHLIGSAFMTSHYPQDSGARDAEKCNPYLVMTWNQCANGRWEHFALKIFLIKLANLHDNVYLYDCICRLYYIILGLCSLPPILCCAFTSFPHLNMTPFNDTF